jgi:hypothetical protein
MTEHRLDTLAKQLCDGSGSRRRALQTLAGAVLAMALPALAPHDADASRAKRKCARKGGTWLSTADATSPCHCAATCSSTAPFTPRHCHHKSGCVCLETTEGEGFCGSSVATNGCTSSASCTTGTKCVIVPNGAHGCGKESCATNTDCTVFGPGFACINGTCQATNCVNPCR